MRGFASVFVSGFVSAFVPAEVAPAALGAGAVETVLVVQAAEAALVVPDVLAAANLI